MSQKTTYPNPARWGISLGNAVAVVISYTAHKSIAWAILHGLCSWLYVIYFILKNP